MGTALTLLSDTGFEEQEEREEERTEEKIINEGKNHASKCPSGLAVEAKRRWGLIRIQNLEEECAFSL